MGAIQQKFIRQCKENGRLSAGSSHNGFVHPPVDLIEQVSAYDVRADLNFMHPAVSKKGVSVAQVIRPRSGTRCKRLTAHGRHEQGFDKLRAIISTTR